MDEFRSYALKLPTSVHLELKLLGCKLDKPMSYLVRRALIEYLEKHKNTETQIKNGRA